MARFSKFKILFALKLNFNYKEISKFGYFKNWQSTHLIADAMRELLTPDGICATQSNIT